MASYYELRIVTTITTAAADSVVENFVLGCTDYLPTAAPIENSTATTGYSDGGMQQYARWRNRQEEIEIKFSDVATYDDAELRLNIAHLRAENVATPRVYLYARHLGETDFWRTRLYTARLTPSENSGTFLRSGGEFMATLEIERDYYWERAAIELLRFDNPIAPGNIVTTRNITNNWVLSAPAATAPIARITADFIKGTLPTPVDLFIKNTSAGVNHISRIHIGHNWRSDPATFEPRLGSLATTPITGSAEQTLYGVAILAPAASGMRGSWFRVLLASSNLPGDSLLSVELEDTFGVLLYKSPQVSVWYNGQTLTDAGSVPLPPVPIPLPAVINLRVMIQIPSNAGSVNINSGVFLMPADSYRMLLGQPGFNIKISDTLHDLQSTDSPPFAVMSAFGTSYYPLTPHYGKIWLMPGRHNAMYFMATGAGDVMDTSVTYDISGQYRPRRLTI